MLKKVKVAKSRATGLRFAVVASRYNARYVDSMLRAARRELRAAGAEAVDVVRVPGAFEVPVVAARLARRRTAPYDAILCLGVILRGETVHAEHIGRAVTGALMRLQVETERPLVHEVLLLENTAQARRRCLDSEHNRGREAAQTAIEMARALRALAE
jgi:6,7-dimethyl-8-ribityllumazine synthase